MGFSDIELKKKNQKEQDTGNPLLYLGEKYGSGLMQSIEGIGDYFVGNAQYLFGDKEGAFNTYNTDWFNYGHADEWFNPSEGWKMAGDTASGIGNSTLSLGVAAGVGALTKSPQAARAASLTTLGISAAGRGIASAVQKTGELGGKEMLYGHLSGAVEVGTEMLGMGLDWGTGRIVKQIASKTAQSTAKSLAKSSALNVIADLGKDALKDFFGEALEEGISEFLEPILLKYTGVDPNAQPIWENPEQGWDIAYAALVGGLSGVVMGGVNNTVITPARQLYIGSKSINKGTAEREISISRDLSEAYKEGKLIGKTAKELSENYTELASSLEKTGGKITTPRQRMLLGSLVVGNTAAALSQGVYKEMLNIANNAEAAAKAYSPLFTDESGKPVQITAEDVRKGLKDSYKNDKAGQKALVNDLVKASENNRILVAMATASFTGKLKMQTESYMKYLADTDAAITPQMLREFVEQASEAEKKEYGEILGIQNWESATTTQVAEAIRNNGDTLKEAVARRERARETAKGESKPIAGKFRFRTTTKDGSYDLGNGYKAVKEGNTVSIVNTETGKVTKAMSISQANKVLYQYEKGKAQEAENKSREEAEKIAKEKVQDYDKLSASVQTAIRMTIAQAMNAEGVSDEQVSLAANLAARTGVAVLFDEGVLHTNLAVMDKDGAVRRLIANGMYNGANTVYLNPNETRTQTIETILAHELTHWVDRSVKGTTRSRLEKLAYKGLGIEDPERLEKTNTKYAGSSRNVMFDEYNSTYAERIFKQSDFFKEFLALDEKNITKANAFARKLVAKLDGIEGATKVGRKFLSTIAKAYVEESGKNKGNNALFQEQKVRTNVLSRYNLDYVTKHKAALDKNYDKSESMQSIEAIQSVYDKMVEMWKELSGLLNSKFLNEWNSKQGRDGDFLVFKEQSGYKYNIELSTMCKKGVPLFEAIDTIVRKEIMKQIDSDILAKEEKEVLYGVLKEHGFDIPCAICYVEQARQREGKIIKDFLNGTDAKVGWNSTLKQIEELMAKAGVEYHFEPFGRDITADGYEYKPVSMNEEQSKAYYEALRTLANNEINKINKETGSKRELVKDASPESLDKALKGSLPTNLAVFKTLAFEQNSRRLIGDDMLYSSYTTANLSHNHQMLYSVFNRQGGTGGYKTKQKPVIYLGDILGAKYKSSEVRAEGGIRNQSNSDLQAYLLLDMIQIYADLAAKGYYLHAYTKVPGELAIFGKSGAKLNASLIPSVKVYRDSDGAVDVAKTMENAGLDENGNLLFDGMEGINPDELPFS